MARITLPMETTLGAHSLPARIALQAKAMGLNVTHDQAGGWWSKSHLLTVTGDDEPARRFWDWARRAVAQFEESS
jgi:hypothetical protein